MTPEERDEVFEWSQNQKWLKGLLDLYEADFPVETLMRHLIVWDIADGMAEAVKRGEPLV